MAPQTRVAPHRVEKGEERLRRWVRVFKSFTCQPRGKKEKFRGTVALRDAALRETGKGGRFAGGEVELVRGDLTSSDGEGWGGLHMPWGLWVSRAPRGRRAFGSWCICRGSFETETNVENLTAARHDGLLGHCPSGAGARSTGREHTAVSRPWPLAWGRTRLRGRSDGPPAENPRGSVTGRSPRSSVRVLERAVQKGDGI